jgi:uncharacterized membrane protein
LKKRSYIYLTMMMIFVGGILFAQETEVPTVAEEVVEETEEVKQPAVLEIYDVRASRGETVEFEVEASNLPEGVSSVVWTLDLALEGVEAATVRPSDDQPVNSQVSVAPVDQGKSSFAFIVEAPEGEMLSSGVLARVSFTAPNKIVLRKKFEVSDPKAVLESGAKITLEKEVGTIAITLIKAPVRLFAFMAGVVALIYWCSTIKKFEVFFRFCPPLIWMYFIPMVCTTIGVIPDSSALYSPFMSKIILPAILVLLLIPSDIRSIAQLGVKAVLMMCFATTGIVVGAVVSFYIFTTFTPGALPEETWKGVAALSGSWIGGSPNMFAVLESVGTPPGIIGPLVVVDTVLAYSWLGLLIALSAYQRKIDKYHKADSKMIDEISARLEAEQAEHSRAPRTADIAFMCGIAFVASQVCIWCGYPIFDFVKNTLGLTLISEVVNSYGWSILLITAVGLGLSMTKVRHLDYCGASSLGYIGLYLLLTCYGAQANLQAVIEVPMFFALGFVWLVIHIAFLYAGIRILKAPLFLGATSSMANIGGTASAPVVAAAYNQSMAPVGLLMAILGSTVGTPLALFVVAMICKYIETG